jgi:hypothetical protein
MAPRPKRTKPTKGDLLHQDYRNRAAMNRVYQSSLLASVGTDPAVIQHRYWTPLKYDERK